MFLILLLIGILYGAVCFFLILIILLQSGKGGGLSGMLGGSNPLTDTLGSSGAEKTLNKWTTVCAVGFFIMALLLTAMGSRVMKPSRLSDQLKSSAAPATAPATAPTSTESQSNTVTVTTPEEDKAEEDSAAQETPASGTPEQTPPAETTPANP
ncbi:preprotein translocase subunit SecG [Candidatus Sumerlaeota bacterium]|nr:preprotein translocase subunit SecG [Candidatus Sumerlaeota bacterium]